MRFHECIGAINSREVEDIYTLTPAREGEMWFVVPVSMVREYPERLFFENEESAKFHLGEVLSEGPYKYLVIICEEG